MKHLSQFFKYQINYLLFLLGIFVLPLGLYFQFSPYKAERLPLVILGVLFVSQYAFYREKDFRKKIEQEVTQSLKKELGRLPSGKEVILRSTSVVQYRGVSIVLSALIILILMIIYKEF